MKNWSFLLIMLLLNSSVFAQTPEDINTLEKVVSYDYIYGSDYTTRYLYSADFHKPKNISYDDWDAVPAITKYYTAFKAAENTELGSGKFLIAKVVKELSKEFQSALEDTDFKPYLNLDTSNKTISYTYNEGIQTIEINADIKNYIIKLSKYTDAGAFGDMHTIITTYYGLTSDAAVDILLKSSNNTEALQAAMTASSVPPPHHERIRQMIEKLYITYQASIEDGELLDIMKRNHTDFNHLLNTAQLKDIDENNVVIKNKKKNKINSFSFVVKNQDELKTLFKDKDLYNAKGKNPEIDKYLNGYKTGKYEFKDVVEALGKNAKHEYIDYFVPDKTNYIDEYSYNKKLNENWDILQKMTPGKSLVQNMAENGLITFSSLLGICNRCGMPLSFPICLAGRASAREIVVLMVL